MPRAAVIVPFPYDEEGLDYRRAELEQVELSGKVTFDYKPLKAGPMHFLGRHDEFLVEFAIFEAGIALAEEGYDAITVNTLSDSGVAELRAVLDIPVVSNGKSSLLYALTLGTRFSIIAQTDPAYPQYTDAWLAFYKNLMKKFEVSQFCTSVELFEAKSDLRALFTGREAEVFPIMKETCERGLAKGADVIVLGSTTLSQAGPYLSENLPVPVVNPGPLSLKMVETVLGLGHSHSPVAHPEACRGTPEDDPRHDGRRPRSPDCRRLDREGTCCRHEPAMGQGRRCPARTPTMGAEATWDAGLYDRSFCFVSDFATDMVDLLAPEPGERIVDLGCGTGKLTAAIAAHGADVIGIDGDEAMVERARALHPHLVFQHADGRDFAIEGPRRRSLLQRRAALDEGGSTGGDRLRRPARSGPAGRFVAEMGAYRNIRIVTDALYRALAEEGVPAEAIDFPWYFPRTSRYVGLLEDGGFDVTQLRYFARPTPLDDCPNGLADWIAMFGGNFTDAAPPGRVPAVIDRTIELTRDRLCPDGRWVTDYTRLRFVAVRVIDG